MNLPAIAKPKGRMTEREARIVGASANRLVNLRGLFSDCSRGASITVATRNGTVSQSLSNGDIKAILALLIERESNLLIQYDIDLDMPPP